jgi:PAS domain S-box-containing protein
MRTKPFHKEKGHNLIESLEEMRLLQKEADAFFKATKTIPLCKNFKDSAREIFDIFKDLIGARSGYVALLTEDGRENEILFLESGGLPCDVDPDLPMPIRGLREIAYRTNKVAYDNNFSKSHWMKYMPPGHVKLDNVLFVPLTLGEKPVGLIGLANKPNGFYDRDFNVAKTFGEIAALALKHGRIQENLIDSDRFKKNLLMKSPNPILVINPDKTIRYVNGAFEELSGFAADEVLGTKPPYAWWTEDTFRKTKFDLDDAMISGAHKVEEKFQKKNGQIFYVEITSTPVMDDEDLDYYLANWVDITEKKIKEKDLLKKTAQLEIHSQKLEEMNTALKVLITHRNEEMERMRKELIDKFDKLVFPYFSTSIEARPQEELSTIISILEQNIKEILFRGGEHNLTSYANLTPMEARVAAMIKSEKSSKEIAETLNISLRAVYFHRDNIRKKLNLSQTKTNLKTYLQSKGL